MSKTISPSRGMRDFLPADKLKRERAIDLVRKVYQSFGYLEIETPMLEDLDRLQGSGGGENLSMIFQVQKRGLDSTIPILPEHASDLGLRYDLTLPLARFYASHAPFLPSEFRTIQIGPVWRAERPQKGRFRQFTQCDIDIIGIADERAEVELIGVTLLALKEILVGEVTVRLNDRRLLIALLNAFGFQSDIQPAVLITVDKLDKIGVLGVFEELSLRYPTASIAIRLLIDFLDEIDHHRDVGFSFDDIAKLIPSTVDPTLIAPLRYIYTNVKIGVPDASIRFDPTLVRGMGYYTGPIFEIEVAGQSSSIAGGGRYDGMIGRFSGKDVPACGFSLGFERIVELLGEQLSESPNKLIMFYDESLISSGLLFSNQLSYVRRGYEVTAMKLPKKLGKTLDAMSKEGFGAFINIVDLEIGGAEIKLIAPSNS